MPSNQVMVDRPTGRADSNLLTIAEVADYLSLSQDTIRRMIARGELRAWRYGPRVLRIDRADVDRLRQPATPLAAYREGRAQYAGGAA